MMKHLLVLAVSLMLIFSSTSNVVAGERANLKDSRKDDCRLISSNEAIKRAKAKTGGRVVSIQLSEKGAKSVYRVRVLVDEKRIKNITIKACK